MTRKLLKIQETAKSCTSWCVDKVKTYKNCLGLVFLNFLTHYIFISRYSFVTDDWSELVYCEFNHYSITTLLLESQRPLYYAIFRIAGNAINSFAFIYQVFNFITTSLIILLVYFIARSLLKNVWENPDLYAFLTAIFFCVVFNIDQLFPWSIIFANNLAYILFLGSFYFYINADRNRYYLALSLFSFLVAAFIYEVGIFLPLVFLGYDIIFHRNWKNSLFFLIPIGIVGIIRETHWFGCGWVLLNRDQILYSSQFFQQYNYNIMHNFVREIALTGLNILYGIEGLLKLNPVILVMIILTDIACIFLITRYLIQLISREHGKYNFRNALKLCCVAVLGFLLFHIAISLAGYAETRHLIFMDIFILILIIALAGPLLTKRSAVILVFCIIFVCVLLNQGLSVNWIIAGDISASANQSISENSENVSSYNYIVVNASDLFTSAPDAALKATLFNDQYAYYLNAPCLPDYTIMAMLSGAGVNMSGVHFIYGSAVDGNPTRVIYESGNGSIQYEDVLTKTYYSINRTEYFEFNSTNLLATYHEKEGSDFLFQH
jgi:hypothetical protein